LSYTLRPLTLAFCEGGTYTSDIGGIVFRNTKLRKDNRMKSLKGTRTEKNLLTTFAGESQARNRYTFFASVARKEEL